MYTIDQIKHVHLEISSRCNAACPLCPRNFYGYEYNDGYVEHDMSLLEAQTIFQPQFLKQLEEIYVNGNFGDIVMNREATDILDHFRSHNPDLLIKISTNGGARDRDFWVSLAQLGARVIFCLDGLEDTHSLYRRNTSYHTVLKNAETFIRAGGYAVWKMIEFDHNLHQRAQAKDLSVALGFREFVTVDHGRSDAPVFDKDQKLTHVIGKPQIIEFHTLWQQRTQDLVLLEDIIHDRKPAQIECEVKKKKSIYISSTGDVYPCCFLGFSPGTYGHGNYHQAANAQFRSWISANNAVENELETCIRWFAGVENSWQKPSFEQGRLVICNDVCGQCQ